MRFNGVSRAKTANTTMQDHARTPRQNAPAYSEQSDLTLTPPNLTPNPRNLTQKLPQCKMGRSAKTTSKRYNLTISNIQSYASYVSLAHGVCARPRTRARCSTPLPRERVRCVRSGFVPSPSGGFHLTLERKIGVRYRQQKRKITTRFKTGRINGGVR